MFALVTHLLSASCLIKYAHRLDVLCFVLSSAIHVTHLIYPYPPGWLLWRRGNEVSPKDKSKLICTESQHNTAKSSLIGWACMNDSCGLFDRYTQVNVDDDYTVLVITVTVLTMIRY